MTIQIPIIDLSPERRKLWERVNELWALSTGRNEEKIRSLLHPHYVGWDMNSDLPHDREAAVHSVSDNPPELSEYVLHPLSVEIYDGTVGIVHYSYSAMVASQGNSTINITGKWSEVYLMQKGEWIMLSVSGRPDLQRDVDRTAVHNSQ